MRVCKAAFFASFLLTFAVRPTAAQESNTVSVTPYVAVGSEQSSPVGVAITFPLTSTFSLETDVAYRRGEGRMHALSTSTSLICSLPELGSATPYLAAGIGLSQYGSPVFSSGGIPVGTQSRVALTMNAGGGLNMPVNDALGLRTDARWFKSFGNQGSEQFRVAQGISFDVGR